MTQEEFDKYRFSIKTEVNYFGERWDKVKEIDFQERWVRVERGQIIMHNEIKDIRENI